VNLRRQVLRIAVVLVVTVGSFLGLRQLSGMNPVFFRLSWPGAKALTLYLAGRYVPAVSEYRAHWRASIAAGGGTRDVGTDLLLAGDLDGAERFARRQLTQRPNDVSALLLLAELALERGAPADAIRLARQALVVEPDVADGLVALGVAHARAGAAGDAIDAFGRVLRTGWMGGRLVTFYQLLETAGTLGARPAPERPWCLLAHVHRYFRVFDRSHARSAARYARQAIAAGDRAADAHVSLGILSEKAGRLDDAMASFQAAIAVDPRHAEAHRLAASMYGQRGDLANEYRMISTALAESGDPFYADYLYDVLVNKVGDAARAAGALQPLAAKEPGNARLRERLGYVFSLLGDEARSLEHYRAAIALTPKDAVLHSGMGVALERLGKLDEAIAAQRRAVSLAPALYQPHANLAGLYLTTHRYQDGIRAAQEALRLGEPRVYIHAMLCNFYHYEVDLERGEACCEALLARDPGNVWARALLPKIRRDAAAR
jgi:tetratricopeptide (TPR) repeat protein